MKRTRWILLAALIAAFAIAASSSWHWSATYDEGNHLEMGRRIVEEGNWERFDNSKMPVTALNGAPWVALQEADPSLRLWAARLPQAGWWLGTALVVFGWARRRHGEAAALAAACLLVWEPNGLAHASVVTTDAPCVFFTAASAWLLVRALERDRWRDHALAGLAFGGALVAKFTSAFLLPLYVGAALAWCALSRRIRPLRGIPVYALAAWLALGAGHGFQDLGVRGAEVQWQSETFNETLAPLTRSELPLPLPLPWLQGLDWVKADDDRGHGNIYVDGVMTPDGQRDYYLRALPWKLPLPWLVLPLAGLLRWRARYKPSDLVVAAPIVFFGLYFSLAFNFQLGVRYVLPMWPFLALLAARLPPRWIWAGAIWTLLSGLSWWPWGLSYFNERLTDRVQAWRHLADSNLDWGQTEGPRAAWLAEHPGALSDPEVPAPGPQIVSANVLTGVLGDPARLACYRAHLPPSEHLAYALYPLDPSFDDLAECFPRVAVDGHAGGLLPAGEHLVVTRFRGRATLTIGGWSASGESGGESLLGAVVTAADRFDVEIDHAGPEVLIFVDGAQIDLPSAAPSEETP